MRNFKVKIGNLNIEIQSNYDYTFLLCKDYLSEFDKADIIVNLNKEELNKYYTDNFIDKGENLAIYNEIAKNLSKFKRLLIHAAAIAYKDKAYLFLAPSGTGKTTHIKLWLANNKEVSVINGDKPIIDNKGTVYGTPWSGKEGLNNNTCNKLAGVILLHRDNYNHIEKIDKQAALKEIVQSIYRNDNIEDNLLIIDEAIKDVPIYNLYCTKDKEAYDVCFKGVIHENL